MFATKLSLEIQITKIWVAGIFLTAINATAFNEEQKIRKFEGANFLKYVDSFMKY